MATENHTEDSAPHQIFQLKSPAMEILLCRRDVLNYWQTIRQPMPYWRLYHAWNQGGQIQHHGEIFFLQPGEVWLIAPYTEISTSLSEPIDKFYIHFLVSGDFGSCRDFCCRLVPSDSLLALIEAVGEKLKGRQPVNHQIEYELWSIISLALSLLPPIVLVQVGPEKSGLVSVWHLIQKNPMRNFSNQELAAHARMGLSTFIRRFYHFFGISPQHYLLEQKLRHAATLLQNTRFPIKHIALDCGFCDQYHFSKTFRKFYGFSPGDFRKRQNDSTLEKVTGQMNSSSFPSKWKQNRHKST